MIGLRRSLNIDADLYEVSARRIYATSVYSTCRKSVKQVLNGGSALSCATTSRLPVIPQCVGSQRIRLAVPQCWSRREFYLDGKRCTWERLPIKQTVLQRLGIPMSAAAITSFIPVDSRTMPQRGYYWQRVSHSRQR